MSEQTPSFICRHIAHAGYVLQSSTTSVALDPWFFSSTIQDPLIKGVLPGQSTVDFQVPRAVDSIENFHPQVVLLSHFHTHHSPLPEILHFAKNNQHPELILAGPSVSLQQYRDIYAQFGDLAPRIRFLPLEKNGMRFTVGDLQMTGFKHTQPGHVAWLVERGSSSFFHLADSRATWNPADRRLDGLWYQFSNLNPSLIALTAGSHMRLVSNEPRRRIVDGSVFSPAEAARLVQLMQPKAATIMGIGNHSHYSQRTEVSLPTHVIQDQFEWALHFLEPKIRFLRFNPGHQLDLALLKQDNSPAELSY